jgi:ABC-type multidrug transport system fused ATPase/permease subunit
MLIMMLTMVIAAPMMAIGGVILALSQDAQLAWVLVAVMPVMAVVFALIMRGRGAACPPPCRSRSSGSTWCSARG